MQTLTASRGGDEAVASLAVDGEEVAARPTLGGDDVAYFQAGVGSNSMARGNGNYLIVNGSRVAILDTWVSETTQIPVPYDLLVHGRNTIVLHAGATPAYCGLNYDDFGVSNFNLELADGTRIRDDEQHPVITLGDGNCGHIPDRPQSVELSFTIPGEPGDDSGLLHELDTSSLTDGEHQVTAVSATGAETTHTYTVDNTGPALTSSTPAADDHVVGDVVLAAEVADEAGLRGDIVLTLDGETVTAGHTLSSDDLVAGEHELVVEAQDRLGNSARHVVAFTTAPRTPAFGALAPADGTTDVGDAVDLSVEVTDPNGADVTTTFYAADRSTPSAAHQGTLREVPLGQLDLTGQQEAPTDALDAVDGEVLRSPAGEDVTFQRFDVPVEAADDDEMVLSWTGEVDPARGVRLYAWDVADASWQQIGDTRGTADAETRLGGTVGPQHVDAGEVHLLVEGYDPFADDIDDAPDGAFRDPGTYDFSLVHMTDTQYYSEGAIQREDATERENFEAAYRGMVNWVVDNAEERNIAYTFHTGDITENHFLVTENEEWNAQVRAEFELADELQGILDDSGMPNGVLPGNHDNVYGLNNDLYNEYFGPERYEALSEGWENAEYGGPWREGDNSAHYDLFTAGGLEFVAVHLPFWASDAQLTWARETLAAYPDRNAILASHDYLNGSDSPDGRGAAFSNPDGQRIYDEVVSQSPNVFLTLTGHIHGVGMNVRTDVAEPGHNVVELLADYQAYEFDGEFMTGFLRLLQFDVDRSEMTVDTYSPWLDNHGATEFDPLGRYDGREDEFTVPVDLSTRTTSIATDSVSVAVLSDDVIGSADVAGEGTASAEWAGLEEGTTYGWYAVAESATGGSAVSPVSTFTTSGEPDDGEEQGPDPEEPGEPTPVPPTPGRGFFLNDGWDARADHEFSYGRRGDTVLVGDWDGDGQDTLAVRRGNAYFLTNSLYGGDADVELTFGHASDVVLVGDWDGDGTDTLAVRRGDAYFLTNSLTGGDAETELNYGRASDVVLVGDYDGDGSDSLTVRRGNQYFVSNSLTGGRADAELAYGRADDQVVVGDWDGDGSDTFAVRRGNLYLVSNSLSSTRAEIEQRYGRASDEVFVGDWDGDGTDTLGIRR